MTYRYATYGLVIESDTAIPGLAHSKARMADIRLWITGRPPWLDQCRNDPGTQWLTSVPAEEQSPLKVSSILNDLCVRFTYADNTEFIINTQLWEIWASWPSEYTLEDAMTYLLGPVLGFVLALRGTTSLHASAIEWKGAAFALAGPSGAGKSTTAAFLGRLGARVLNDDVTPLISTPAHFEVVPGYPRLRLWPSSVEILSGRPDAMPLLTPNWEKRYLDLEGNDQLFNTERSTLKAVYILRDRHQREETIVPEKSASAMLDLVRNTYANKLLKTEMRAREFQLLSKLIESVPIRSVTPNSDPSRLEDLCRRLLFDFEQISRQGG